MQIEKIPQQEQTDMLSSFWTMLKECEDKANNENDHVLQLQVEQWYIQWRRITGDKRPFNPPWPRRIGFKSQLPIAGW